MYVHFESRSKPVQLMQKNVLAACFYIGERSSRDAEATR
jgi:hypothetical protein